MDEFAQIMELLRDAGEGTYWLAFMWIAKGYFMGILTFVFGAGFVRAAYLMIMAGIKSDAFETALAHELTGGSWLSETSQRKIVELIRKDRKDQADGSDTT